MIKERIVPKRPLKRIKKSDPDWDYAVGDGLSRLRRSVLLPRHRVQRLNFSEESVTVCHTCDGPSCHSVTKFRELIFSTQFQIF